MRKIAKKMTKIAKKWEKKRRTEKNNNNTQDTMKERKRTTSKKYWKKLCKITEHCKERLKERKSTTKDCTTKRKAWYKGREYENLFKKLWN